MNAERLHAIAIALKNEMKSQNTVAHMQGMVNNLRAVVQQSNASTQQNFASARDVLYSTLTETPSDRFSPTWRQILRDLGGEDLFGRVLKGRIQATLESNQLTPAIALGDFEKILERMQQFENSLTQITAAFKYFNIGSEELESGEGEIGILIPRPYVKNQLGELLEELKHEEFILNTFSEVATGKPDKLEIKTLSSSGLMIFVQAHATFAAAVAIAIERTVALYKQLLEIRKLRGELQKQQIPEDVVKGVETHANKLMTEGIEKASVDVVNQFYLGKDNGRKNELVTQVKVSMTMLANRIDHGLNIEVRIEPPAADTPQAKDEAVQKAVAVIQAATPNMQFLKLEGPPLLQLPEGTEKEEKSAKSEKSKKKDEK
jgi:hypothetical protein